MPDITTVLPKVLRLRAERIAKVHFDAIYATDNPNVIQGRLPDGKFVVVDLKAKKIVKAPQSYEGELAKKAKEGIIAPSTVDRQKESDELAPETLEGSFKSAITRDKLPTPTPSKPKRKTTTKSTGKKSSKK